MLELNENILRITLPEGKTQAELVSMMDEEFKDLESSRALFGKDIKIDGRITTAMALDLGHKLAHICKSVSIFDPKLNEFVLAVHH